MASAGTDYGGFTVIMAAPVVQVPMTDKALITETWPGLNCELDMRQTSGSLVCPRRMHNSSLSLRRKDTIAFVCRAELP